MANLNLKSLLSKLNTQCSEALTSAIRSAMSRENYNLEIEHWLEQLLEISTGDFDAIISRFGIDRSRLLNDLNGALNKLKVGNTRPPGLSQDISTMARESWLLASVQFGASEVRSGHLLLAMLSNDALKRQALEVSAQFEHVSVEALENEFSVILDGSSEETVAAPQQPSSFGQAAGGTVAPTKSPALDQFTSDLTERAGAGEIDPVVGREAEIRQVIDILARRRQNNPILTGEAGVGKTAVVEGFALRIAAGDVPPALQNVSLRLLDLSLLQAGAGVKGEFENRLKEVMKEVKASPKPVILFIDEAHTLIGAGGQAGQGDAANLLKPALARGELRTIAATTWAEYKKYFEKDPALTRRFQVVKVEEPDEENATRMMQGMVTVLENHHNVTLLHEAIEASVKLSHRYIQGRQLPDKAISLLDTACARVALSQSATPPAVEDAERRVFHLQTAIDIQERELATGDAQSEEIEALKEALTKASQDRDVLQERLVQERELVDEIKTVRSTLVHGNAGQPDGSDTQAQTTTADAPDRLRNQLATLNERLSTLQDEAPLVHVCVDEQSVAEVVAAWTGIPVGRMVSDEITAVQNLKSELQRRVIGQSHALEAISQSILVSRAQLTDPNKPIGVFLMAGTSGVGKTETALALAEILYGGRDALTVINMSEFKEEHKVSTLMGAPPGYVGYGEGGVLTEAVRRRPYGIVLLDEMEKAHPGVQDIFYQVFDKGSLRDSEGRDIDFKNTIVIMTSNAGTETIQKLCADPETMPDPAGLAEALRPDLLNWFKPAFLGRVTMVPYFPLTDEIMSAIIKLQLGRIADRVEDNYGAEFAYDANVVEAINARCQEVESGARNIDSILNGTLLPQLSAEFLDCLSRGEEITHVNVGLSADGTFSLSIERTPGDRASATAAAQ